MSSPEQMPQLERGVVIAGKYCLAEPLERGGMGAVWVAHHQDLGVDVALKFVLPGTAAHASGQARFRREARAAARLKSPHSAQIYDYGVDQGLAYIAMELLAGHHLGSELKQRGFLPPERVAAICGQVAKALGEAHQVGIVHRDVKPPNIFLAQVAGEEIVKLLDFGIAKVLAVDVIDDHIATDTGTMLGTPRYMSPEQACGDPIDSRSDLFSLAAVAYEALTGERLFTAQHLGELVVQVTNAKVPPLQSVRPGLPEQLDAFFAQAMAVNPELRFQSAADFAAALAAACAGQSWSQPIIGDDTLDVAMRPASAGQAASARSVVTATTATTASPIPTSKQDDTRIEGRATDTSAAATADDTHIDTATTSVTNTAPRIEAERSGSGVRRWPLVAALVAVAGGAWWALSSAQRTAPAHEESVAASSPSSASARPSAGPSAVAANPDLSAAAGASASAKALGALLSTASPSSVSSLNGSAQPRSQPTQKPQPAQARPARPQPVSRPPTSPKPKPAADGIFDPRPKK